MRLPHRFTAMLCMAFLLGPTAWGAPAKPVTVQPVADLAPDFIMGADMSMLDQLERQNAKFQDASGARGDAIAIVRDNGVNWIRLRLWHTPVNDSDVIEGGRIISRRGEPVGGGNNDLATTIRLAKRAKAAGLKVLLDIHYSDFWVDPGKQNKPAAWRDLHGEALEQAVYTYTLQVMNAMKKADVMPAMVQVGNELNGGMLWPDGQTWVDKPGAKIGGDAGFVALMKQGIRAVREADPQRGTPQALKVVVHLADGGNNELYRRVFDLFQKNEVDYDVIGLSYYAYYHGPVEDLQANMDDIAFRYGKDVAVVETAYAYTTLDNDGWPNLFNADMQKSVGYKATVQGQASMVRDVIDAVAKVPGGRGIGVFYWEPDWVPMPRTGWRTGEGNGWENQAMFDFDGRALPSLAVFKRVRDAGTPADVPQVLQAEPVRLTAFAGQSWTPPESLRLPFSDDAMRTVYVQWDDVDPANLGQPGRFQLKGEAMGRQLQLVADVHVVPRRNLVDDPGFEQGGLKEWTITGDSAAASNERNPGNAHSGLQSLHYWLGSAFRFEVKRTFSGLKEGQYTLKAWSSGGGGEKNATLFARECGNAAEKSAPMVNTGWQKWKQATVRGIQIPASGQCTVGVLVDAPAGTWGNVDDIEFLREDGTP